MSHSCPLQTDNAKVPSGVFDTSFVSSSAFLKLYLTGSLDIVAGDEVAALPFFRRLAYSDMAWSNIVHFLLPCVLVLTSFLPQSHPDPVAK